jgi:hypothetical protein
MQLAEKLAWKGLKQVIRVEELKRGLLAMHCHLDITPNHPQLPLHPFTKI